MVAAILVELRGDNRIAIVPGALSALAPEHVDAFADRIAAADVLLVQLEIPVVTAHRALEIAHEAGVRTVLNPAPAPPAVLPEDMLALADYCTPNETEAAAVSGAPGTVVLTLGEEGARLGDEVTPAFARRWSTRPALATRSTRRSPPPSPAAWTSVPRSGGAARPEPTWSSTLALSPGCRPASSSSPVSRRRRS